jgi:hypothetical protein
MSRTSEVELEAEIDRIRSLPIDEIRALWRQMFKSLPPPAFGKDMLGRVIAHHIQEKALGGLSRASLRLLDDMRRGKAAIQTARRRLKQGTVLVREYQGERHSVVVSSDGFVWRDETYSSLTTIARLVTGTNWNGPKFFGLRLNRGKNDEREMPTRGPSRGHQRRAR